MSLTAANGQFANAFANVETREKLRNIVTAQFVRMMEETTLMSFWLWQVMGAE